jgi:hypothetical protein
MVRGTGGGPSSAAARGGGVTWWINGGGSGEVRVRILGGAAPMRAAAWRQRRRLSHGWSMGRPSETSGEEAGGDEKSPTNLSRRPCCWTCDGGLMWSFPLN